MSHSSSELMPSRLAWGSPPNSLTTALVETDSSQTAGRMICEKTLRGEPMIFVKPTALCRASLLGTSSPSTKER